MSLVEAVRENESFINETLLKRDRLARGSWLGGSRKSSSSRTSIRSLSLYIKRTGSSKRKYKKMFNYVMQRDLRYGKNFAFRKRL